MLINFNDYLSLFSIIAIMFLLLRMIFVTGFGGKDKISISKVYKDFVNYRDNTDE